MGLLGFDFEHGRLDVSSHPFCGGVPSDVRITTRYDESDFMKALFGVIHETGHGRYEQNLPRDLLEGRVGDLVGQQHTDNRAQQSGQSKEDGVDHFIVHNWENNPK